MDRNRIAQGWARIVDWLGARKPIEVIALMTVPIALVCVLAESLGAR